MGSAVTWVVRVVVTLVLVALGVLSLPLVAIVLDGPGQEPWIIPLQVVVMAGVGAGVGLLVPSLAGAGASRTRSVVVGAVIALAGVAVGLVLFVLLLAGLDGL